MSLLGSLLGPGGSKPSTPSNPAAGTSRSRDTSTQILKRPPLPPNTNKDIRNTAQRPIGTTTNGSRPLQPPVKRKAEGEVDGARPKAQRGDSNSNDNSARHGTNLASTNSAGAYRGTAAMTREKLPIRPVKATGTLSTSGSAQRPQTKSLQSATRPTSASSPATKPPTSTTQAAPKKGSYAEIMARASAANASAPTAGIKHKVKEPINLKKLKAEAQLAEKNKASDQRKGGLQKGLDRRGIQPNSQEAGKAQQKKRKPIELGYKGTARPAPPNPTAPIPPTYKGTMGMKRPDTAQDRPGTTKNRNPLSSKSASSRRSRNEYYATDEDEEDDDDENSYGRDDQEDNYYSDASSDMEANIFDVDREEQDALKAAKREDADEQAKLERLEREKRQRKQLALAKALNEKKERRRFM